MNSIIRVHWKGDKFTHWFTQRFINLNGTINYKELNRYLKVTKSNNYINSVLIEVTGRFKDFEFYEKDDYLAFERLKEKYTFGKYLFAIDWLNEVNVNRSTLYNFLLEQSPKKNTKSFSPLGNPKYEQYD